MPGWILQEWFSRKNLSVMSINLFWMFKFNELHKMQKRLFSDGQKCMHVDFSMLRWLRYRQVDKDMPKMPLKLQ